MVFLNYTNYFYIKSFFFKHILNEIYFFFKFLEKVLCTRSYRVVCMPYRIKKFTVVKSPFVSKLSREQFELRTYKVVLVFSGVGFIIENIYFLNKVFDYFKNSYIYLRVKGKC